MTKLTPPIAKTEPCAIRMHGDERVDPYAWMRAENWQEVLKDPSCLPALISAHLKAENRYADAFFEPLSGLKQTIRDEMIGRIKQDDADVPERDGDFYYFSRYRKGGQYPLYCRSKGYNGANAEVLFDSNREAVDAEHFGIGAVEHSPDHRLLGRSIDTAGSEYYTIRFRNVETDEDLPEKIENANAPFVWHPDSKSVFYVRKDRRCHPRYVFQHVLGTPTSDDVKIYEEQDGGFFVDIETTLDRRFLVIVLHGHPTTEIRFLDFKNPRQGVLCLAPRKKDIEYHDFEHRDGEFIFLTNDGGATDFKVVRTPVGRYMDRASWTDLIPHRSGVLRSSMLVFTSHFVILETEKALPRIVVTRFADNNWHTLSFDEEAYSLGIMSGFEFDPTHLRFTYSSPATPYQTWDLSLRTYERELRKEQEIPSGHDPSRYVVRRIDAKGRDGGTKIPVTLLYREDTPIDGSAPLLLYGYGTYGINMPAEFDLRRFSLVDRGFVYAIAHIRGGSDCGYQWYLDGKRMHKKHTFEDFVDAAEYLVRERFTYQSGIVTHGRSAGGLLVGATLNMRPDLWAGVIADVPFVDCLNTMSDATLPLTPPEWAEWGNPIENRDVYRYMRSYTPYENVAPFAYPPVFIQTGLTDYRVTYWEPAKWAAKLRAANTGTNPIVFKIEMEHGHGGATGRLEQFDEDAEEYAFALFCVEKV